MTLLIYKICILFSFILISLPQNVFGGPKIYIIRHAEVDIERPGWCSSNKAYMYREDYNKAPIRNFDPGETLVKIDNPEEVDTVFCSPQLRAIQTALILFNNSVILNINDNLMELQYPVIKWPFIRMPARVWTATSLLTWMAGINNDTIPTYRQRKKNLENYSEDIIDFAERHGKCIIVAHGVVNRELIKILKKKGWEFEDKGGHGNLSVNCLKI